MKIGGYNVTLAPGKILFRANAWRLFQGFLGKGLAIPLSVLFFLLLRHNWGSFWGVTICGVLSAICFIWCLVPETLKIEIEGSRVTRYATFWGYPVISELDYKPPLKIKCTYYTPTKGFMRSVQLAIVQGGETFDIVAISGASRDSLDRQVAGFRDLLKKELQIDSEVI